MEGHFYNVNVENKKDKTLPLACFLVPVSQGLKGTGQSGWKDNVAEGMRFFLHIAHGYYQDLLMKSRRR